MRKIKIGNKFIGEGEPCFIIAEVGSNHNGKLEQAKKLIDVASEAKVDAVKFQVFRAEKLYPKNAGISKYLKIDRPIFEIIKEMEMPYEWIPKLTDYCKEKSIIFLASVFDEKSVDKLDAYVLAHKIASYELTHTPLIKYIAKKQKPMILSTGASTLLEIEEAVQSVYKERNKDLCLMQCTAKYPAPLSSINVRVVKTLKEKFKIPVGLSDHSREPFIAPLAAVALGANLIEKHFTLDNSLPGPDHKFALEPNELKEMVEKIRMVEKVLGSEKKEVERVEKELYDFAKRRIHATKDIKKGGKITLENIAVLRSGKIKSGVEPKYLEDILGKKVKRDVKLSEGITWDVIE